MSDLSPQERESMEAAARTAPTGAGGSADAVHGWEIGREHGRQSEAEAVDLLRRLEQAFSSRRNCSQTEARQHQGTHGEVIKFLRSKAALAEDGDSNE